MQQQLPKKEYWTGRRLWRLTWPLVVEQLLVVTMGMVDTAMVSSVGEAAVSGISLVDSLNVLLVALLTALATGGAVVASQYMGRKEAENASRAAAQLMYSVTAFSLVLGVLCLVFRRGLLGLIYGHIEPDVMQNADTYFWLSALSYPFLAVYNAGAALFRSMGNSRVSMVTSLLVNLLNIGGNILFIYGFGWGVAGAATSTLISRAASAVVIVWLLVPQRPGGISLHSAWPPKFDGALTRSILRIGIPGGIEGSIFQIGKILVSRIVSTFGTAAIAGNAIAGILATFVNVGGMAIGMALITVVGQCVGAGDYTGARRQTRRLLAATHLSMFVVAVLLFVLMNPLLSLFDLSAEATDLARRILQLFCAFSFLFWPPSFALPNALRAAGDARFTMGVSMFTMWVFRIGVAFLCSYTLGLGAYGVWVAMVVDWVARSAFFVPRWLSGKWQSKQVI